MGAASPTKEQMLDAMAQRFITQAGVAEFEAGDLAKSVWESCEFFEEPYPTTIEEALALVDSELEHWRD